MKPHRCCLLGPNWSTMLSVVTETPLHALKAFFQGNLFCFTDPGLLITVLSCHFKLFRLNCICWMYPLSTLPCSGSLFTVLTRLRYDLWWLVGFDPASFCGVRLVLRDQMQCYEYLHYKLHLLNDYLSPNLITYSNWLILWESPFRKTYLHLESISVQVPGGSGRISAAPAQSEQSDSITPRCGHFWLTGSMMRVDYSETSEATPFLTLCSFKSKILFKKPDITWTRTGIHLYTIRSETSPVIQVTHYLLFFSYVDSNLPSFLFLLRWINLINYPFCRRDGLLLRLLMLYVFTSTAICLPFVSPSSETAPDCQIIQAPKQICLQIRVFHFTCLFANICWNIVQTSKVLFDTVYDVMLRQITASEAIRFSKPDTTSKAYSSTAFGPRTFFPCLYSHNMNKVSNSCHKIGLLIAPFEVTTSRIV